MGCDFYLIKSLLVTTEDGKEVLLEVWRKPYYDSFCGYHESTEGSSDEEYDPEKEERRRKEFKQCLVEYQNQLVSEKKPTVLFQDGKWVRRCKNFLAYKSMVKDVGKEILRIETRYHIMVR